MLAKIFGEDTAEYDTRLWKYFIETPSYHNAYSGNKRFILGRKGSGKSAICQQLRRNLIKDGKNVIFIFPESSDSYRLKSKLTMIDTKKYSEIDLEAHFRSLWGTMLKCEIAKFITMQVSDDKSRDFQKIKRFVDKYYSFDTPNNFRRVVDVILKSIDKINVKLGPVNLHAETEVNKELGILMTSLLLVIKQHFSKGIFILIDNLDEYWDKTKASLSFFRGLLSAATDIFDPATHIYPVLFISTDVYQQVAPTFRNIDKIHQWEEEIKWKKEALRLLITKRIEINFQEVRGMPYKRIWYTIFPEKVGKNKSFNYMIDRTLYRPRDILQFCRLAAEQAHARNAKTISDYDIKAVETTYSDWKAQDLQAEQYYTLPFLKQIMLQGFMGKRSLWNVKSFGKLMEEMVVLIHKLDLDNFSQIQPQALRQFLYQIGFIKVVSNNRKYQYCESPHFPLANADHFEIHAAFWKYLHTTANYQYRNKRY